MPSKPKQYNVLGIGATMEEAFENAVPNAQARGDKAVKLLERPNRSSSASVAEALEGTDGWVAIPTSYSESRTFKLESGLAGKRGLVFRFVKQ
jgi:hypothetical protein